VVIFKRLGVCGKLDSESMLIW